MAGFSPPSVAGPVSEVQILLLRAQALEPADLSSNPSTSTHLRQGSSCLRSVSPLPLGMQMTPGSQVWAAGEVTFCMSGF